MKSGLWVPALKFCGRGEVLGFFWCSCSASILQIKELCRGWNECSTRLKILWHQKLLLAHGCICSAQHTAWSMVGSEKRDFGRMLNRRVLLVRNLWETKWRSSLFTYTLPASSVRMSTLWDLGNYFLIPLLSSQCLDHSANTWQYLYVSENGRSINSVPEIWKYNLCFLSSECKTH